MVSSSSFKSKVGRQPLIKLLSHLVANCESLENDKTLDEFRLGVYNVMEALAKNSKILMSN